MAHGPFSTTAGYLYAPETDSNHLCIEKTADQKAQATITISAATGAATITFQGDTERNTLRYNPSAKRFSCYKTNTANMNDVQIYRRIKPATLTGDVNLDGSVSLSDLAALIAILQDSYASSHGTTDIDGNGKTDLEDVNALLDLLRKK